MTAYLNNIGLEIYLNTNIDLTLATQVQILYRKPSGATGTWNCGVFNKTSILYTTQSGDLSEAGKWKLQTKVTFTNKVLNGQEVVLTVNPNLV